MKAMAAVFLGGGLGSALRFFLSRWIASFYLGHFPVATLAVNTLACFALGIALAQFRHEGSFSSHPALFWTVGFCGGFSTFSALSYDVFTLFRNGLAVSVGAYVALSVLLGAGALAAGLLLARGIG